VVTISGPVVALGLDARGMQRGADQGAAALGKVETSAVKAAQSLARIEQQFGRFGQQGGLLVPQAMVQVEQSVTKASSAVTTFAATFTRRLTNVAGYAKSFAANIGRQLVLAPVFAGLNLAIGAVVTGAGLLIAKLIETGDAAELSAERMERLTAATEAYKRASATVAEGVLAGPRYAAAGDRAGELRLQEDRLRVLREQYDILAKMERGAAVRPSFFTGLGLKAPPGAEMATGYSSRFDLSQAQYRPQQAMEAVAAEIARLEALAANRKEDEAGLLALEKERAVLVQQELDAVERILKARMEEEAARRAAGEAAGERLMDISSSVARREQVALFGEEVVARRELVASIRGSLETQEEAGLVAAESKAAIEESILASYDHAVALEDAAKAAKTTVRVSQEVSRQQAQMQATLSSSITNSTTNFVTGIDSASEALGSFANQLANILIQQAVEPYAEAGAAALTSYLSTSGTATPSAKGNAFAVGGVVHAPTLFQYGAGSLGIMGEAGPEAVLPLKRGADGRLGVAADGGGSVVVNMNIQTPDVGGFRASQRQIAERQAMLMRGR
jgi:hypothetical protein